MINEILKYLNIKLEEDFYIESQELKELILKLNKEIQNILLQKYSKFK